MNDIKIDIIKSGSSGNLYVISTKQGDALLVEAGDTIGAEYGDYDGCILSHEHKDHAKYVREFLQRGIPCFMTEGTAEAIGYTHYWLNTVKYKEKVKIGNFIVSPFEVSHDAREPAGFLIDINNNRILYASDTSHIKYKFSGLNYIMLETNYDKETLKENYAEGLIDEEHKKRVIRSHMSLDVAKKFLERNDLSELKEIYLLHLSKHNSNQEKIVQEVQGLTGVPVYHTIKEENHEN